MRSLLHEHCVYVKQYPGFKIGKGLYDLMQAEDAGLQNAEESEQRTKSISYSLPE